jgi:hypothetical protein
MKVFLSYHTASYTKKKGLIWTCNIHNTGLDMEYHGITLVCLTHNSRRGGGAVSRAAVSRSTLY